MAKPSRIDPASNPATNPFSDSWLTRKLTEAADCMSGRKSPTDQYRDRLEAITGQRPDVGSQADDMMRPPPPAGGAMRWQDDVEGADDDENMADDMDGDDADDQGADDGDHTADVARAVQKIVMNTGLSVSEKRVKITQALKMLDDSPAGKGEDDKADDAD